MSNVSSKKSILDGALILSLVGIICKVVGALYRIPLSHIIQEDGMATYQHVFSTYNILLTISSAGLPVAISKLVSQYLALDDPRTSRRVFRLALTLLTVLGLLCTVLMMVFSPQLAQWKRDDNARLGFVTLAPSLVLVCMLSAYRGFIQGQQNMTPTAISQLIESVGKIFICLPLAWLGMKTSPALAAAGMFLGTSAAEAVALIYIMLTTRRKRPGFLSLPQNPETPVVSDRNLIRQLLSFSFFITVNACVVPLSQSIDSYMIEGRLINGAGLDALFAKKLYGAYSGYDLTLINVPTAIATAIAMSIVPSVSFSKARGDTENLQRQSHLSLRLSCLIGLPCSVGMAMLSRELLTLIYSFSSQEVLNETAAVLSISSLTILAFTLVQSTGGILNGLKKEWIPTVTLAAGVGVKILLNYLLIGTPSLAMRGAPIASIACYMISMIPNLLCVYHFTGMKPEWKDSLLKPLLCTALMGMVLWGAKTLLPSGRLVTLVLVVLGVGAYFGAAFLTKTLTPADLKPFLNRFGKKH